MQNRNFIALFLLLISIPSISQVAEKQGLSIEKELEQFIIDSWTSENGLPYNNINHVIQSEEGYIWLSTFDGLLRFDGKSFDVLNKDTDSLMLTNGFYSSFSAPDGKLWLGSQSSGLLYFEDGVLHRVTPTFNKPISSLFVDKLGTVWVGTINSGVFFLKENQLQKLACPELKGVAIRDIREDSNGNLWFASEGKGISVYIKGEACKHYNNATYTNIPNNRVVAIEISQSGKIWAGTTAGLVVIDGTEVKSIPDFNGLSVTDLLEDKYGSLWVATTKGLARISNNKVEWIDGEKGLLGKYIQSLCFDRENNLWVATKGAGLLRIRDGKFTNYNDKMGLSATVINYICQVNEDEFWIGSDKGTVDILKGNTITNFPLPKELQNSRIKDIFKDSQGNVWIGTYKGILKVSPNGEQEYIDISKGLPENRVRIISEDSQGNIWIGTRGAGLCRIDKESKAVKIYDTDSGLGSNFIMCLVQANDGGMIVGTNGGGLSIINQAGEISIFAKEQGFTGSIIFNVLADSDGKIWVVSNSGLTFLEAGYFKSFQRRGGLPSITPFDIEQDKHGNFWMPTSDGVIRFKKDDLLAYEREQTKEFSYQIYDRTDGLIAKECTGAAKSSKSSDGRLWFPTIKGISSIHPDNIPLNDIPPQVAIKKLFVDGEIRTTNNEIRIEAGKTRFEIDYAALSFVAPSKVKFKYKIDGDVNWVFAGQKRQAVYTNLPYGKHLFTVIACNNDGVWNDEGATLEFYLEPHFYETPWAYALGIALFLLLVALIYKIRVRTIKKRNAELERQVLDRTAEINQQKEEIASQRDQIAQSFDKIQTVSEIGRKVTTILDVEDLTASVYEYVNKLMKADGFGIGILNVQENQIDFRGYIEKGEVLPIYSDELSNSNQFSVLCYEKQEGIRVNQKEEFVKYLPDFVMPAHGDVPSSIIYLPLSIENRGIGVITVQSFSPNSYTTDHVTFLQALGSYISIALDNSNAYEIIKDKNNAITDSLRYAQTIQQAVLPTKDRLKSLFDNSFVLFKPKDIVSGDFYWIAQSEDKTKTFLAVADCTGHGVPGAFMSMIGNELLNEIVNVDKVSEPNQILTRLNVLIQKSLKQKESGNTDGMDIGICVITNENDNYNLCYAGAKRPFYYIKSGVFHEIKGDRYHIGGIFQKYQGEIQFTRTDISFAKGDSFYLTTDGFADQASSITKKKIGSKQVREILNDFAGNSTSFSTQHGFLKEFLEKHQANAIQRDDITFLGIQF